MLKTVLFVMSGNIEDEVSEAVCAEVSRAVASLKAEGFDSGVITAENLLSLPKEERLDETFFLCDSSEAVRAVKAMGFCAAGYSHAGNVSEKFQGASFIIQEPDQVDADSYVKIFEREAGLPWTILRTPRCLVREFTVDDLDAICALYDSRARQYLEPPSADRAHEREILEAYIERIYGLYGFGHWAVLAADPEELHSGKKSSGERQKHINPLPVKAGTLIGRIGFSAITAEREAEAASLGIRGIDADFGFLVASSCRGTGVAEEVCSALLRYGAEMLGFLRVSADAHPGNRASIRLLEKLGFVPVGQTKDKVLFIRDMD